MTDNEEDHWKFELGAEVYFRDPDQGISSGYFMVIERIYEAEDRDLNEYLLSNTRFNVEAYQKDLSNEREYDY